MAPKTAAALLAFLLVLGAGTVGCHSPRARSERSFDEIQALAHGKTADQVLRILGEPDSRQVVFDADERWIWWNYTFLDGNDCPPEMRGLVVHLEILFRNPERTHASRRPYTEWQVDDVLGITWRAPFTDG